MYIVYLALFNLYAEYIMRNVWLDESQAGIKIAGEYQQLQICMCQQPQICR